MYVLPVEKNWNWVGLTVSLKNSVTVQFRQTISCLLAVL